MLHQVDLKVQLLAGFAIIVASIAEVETFLRFLLLIVSIIYTIYKIVDRFKEKEKEKKGIITKNDDDDE
jgi:hypothetical protein